MPMTTGESRDAEPERAPDGPRTDGPPTDGARTDGVRTPGVTLTALGGLLVVLIPTVLAGLFDAAVTVGYGAVTGFVFLVGCVVAAARTRTRDLALLAASPPWLFALGVVLAETVRTWGTGNWVRQDMLAVVTALSGNALWIAAGALAAAIICTTRWVRSTPQRRSGGASGGGARHR